MITSGLDRQRETERETHTQRQRDTERDREIHCACSLLGFPEEEKEKVTKAASNTFTGLVSELASGTGYAFHRERF